MATSIGGWFDKVFFDSHGEPCASGELRFYQTGTDIPQGVATFDGTPLGAVIRLDDDGRPESDFRFYTDKIYRVVVVDADGVVVKTIDGVAIPEGEGGGMYNPMTAAGDVIVGGTGGVAERLAAGSEGYAFKIVNGVPKWAPDAEGMQNPMTTAGDLIVGNTDGTPDRLGIGTDGDILATASGAPTWEGGPKKYRNVYQNIPSPQIDDGYLGCLFYLSGSAQALTLPSSANIPSKAFIDFVFLDDTATLTITPQGTTTLNEQATAVTIGGQSATLYRLTFLGHCGSGDEWALGGSGNGDHKVSADGTDTAGYLEDKLGEGSGISLAKSGGKIVFSVTGGGGGGGAPAIIEPFKMANCTGTANDAGCAVMQFAPYKFTPTALTYYVNAYTGSTRKIKGVVYNSAGKVVYSSAELPLVNKMNTIPLSKVTTYEDKAYFTPGELFFIGVAISSGDSSYQWWTMSSYWYKSFVMSYPPPDTKSSTNQNTIHWMSLTVTPLS